MRTEMVMPQMGESIAEATVLKWKKKVGDKVEKDETILEISTDKVDSEIPATASGDRVEIIAAEGATVAVKSIIAVIDSENTVGATPTNGATTKIEVVKEVERPVAVEAYKANVNMGAEKTVELSTKQSTTVAKLGTEKTSSSTTEIDDKFYSPLVKNIASQHGMSETELSKISGSGIHGRVTKSDLITYIDSKGPSDTTSKIAVPIQTSTAPVQALIKDSGAKEGGDRVEPFDRMRKIISEHMVRSKATSPHVYSIAEVDMTNIAKFRERIQPSFLKREGFKISFMPFFLEAVGKALVKHPTINASVDGESLIIKKNINLGCAVALGTTGLVVPVIKNIDQLNTVGIAHSLNDVANRARNKALKPDDVQGGTFTVTNIGSFGNIIGCPIINQPQLAILAVGAIKKRVMVVDEMIAIRDMAYLTLSYDHRVIDGSLGGQFVQSIVKYLEAWDTNSEI